MILFGRTQKASPMLRFVLFICTMAAAQPLARDIAFTAMFNENRLNCTTASPTPFTRYWDLDWQNFACISGPSSPPEVGVSNPFNPNYAVHLPSSEPASITTITALENFDLMGFCFGCWLSESSTTAPNAAVACQVAVTGYLPDGSAYEPYYYTFAPSNGTAPMLCNIGVPTRPRLRQLGRVTFEVTSGVFTSETVLGFDAVQIAIDYNSSDPFSNRGVRR
ncbi:hypothetical protein K402DRAFT_452223 [Aulographum hederae CBS 113979]|uniref:Uncharacterized protein n=1 Tax=Aulographum hederae CBS 113979 TaxID=1176131 RepID=A0A6G1H8J0_9PEZI|nr:hypothetical protein K402DRAFT_452223 [Aulographum hederae CBS 113979]